MAVVLSARGQDLDHGLVQVDVEPGVVVQFYKSPNDKAALKRVEIIHDSAIGVPGVKGSRASCEWLEPELFAPDESQFYMICKSQAGEWMEVVVNDEKDETMWVKKSGKVRPISWLEFLHQMFVIERENPESNPICTKPDKGSSKLQYTGTDLFKARSIKADWMEIYTLEGANESDGVKEKISSGWIRWRDKDGLIISYQRLGV